MHSGRGVQVRAGPTKPSATAVADRRDDGRPTPPLELTGFLRRPSRRVMLLASALSAIVLASFFPAILGGFIWDDIIFTTSEVVREPSGLATIWFSPSGIEREAHYWPVTYTSFWLGHKLWGFSPVASHAVNVLLHLVNCLLLWHLMVRLAVPGAWLVAAVFAVHPVHVESVAWVIERKDLLSGLFYLTAALTYMRHAAEPRRSRYVLALVLFAAALLSKSVAVTLPVALLIWLAWKHGLPKALDLWRLVPFFVLAVGITVADLAFYRGREVLSFDYSLVERALIAGRALWFYVAKLVWPTELAVIYPLWEVTARDLIAWLCLAAACATVVLLWTCRHRIGTGPLAGAFFFAVTLSPVLGFVDYGYMQFSFVADRYQYLACIGLIAPVVGSAARGIESMRGASLLCGRVMFAMVLAVLGWLTWQQSAIYRNPVTFFTHIIGLNPEARRAHYNLSAALAEAGQYEESLAVGLVAEKQSPEFPDVHANLGRTLAMLDRFEEAESHLLRALELDPRHERARYNLAEALRVQGSHDEALEWYLALLETNPDHVEAHVGRGNALFDLGRFEEAVDAMDRAVSIRPSLKQDGSVHRFMGRALQKAARFDEAIEHFRRALSIDPNHAAAIRPLAAMLFQRQQYEEARDLYRSLTKISPGDAQAAANLAVTEYYLGRTDEAIRGFERSLALDPTLELARTGLATVRSAPSPPAQRPK